MPCLSSPRKATTTDGNANTFYGANVKAVLTFWEEGVVTHCRSAYGRTTFWKAIRKQLSRAEKTFLSFDLTTSINRFQILNRF